MVGVLDGRIAIVTGAGRGLGREHALELARQGAKVVVNDFGVSLAGAGEGDSPAEQVVAEIRAAGGEAVANGADVADFARENSRVFAYVVEHAGAHPAAEPGVAAAPYGEAD